MKLFKYTIFILVFLASHTNAQSGNDLCFKVGAQWHDISLPSHAKNLKWLFADDNYHTPFMSISFDIDEKDFFDWAKNCKLTLKKIGGNQYWSQDIELGTGGVVNVVRYESGRYCISVERTSTSDVEMKLNGTPYFGCPINRSISY